MIKALIHENGINVYIVLVLSLNFDIVQQDQNIEYEILIYMIHTNLSKFIPCSIVYFNMVGNVKFVTISTNNVLHAYKADPQKKLLHFPN